MCTSWPRPGPWALGDASPLTWMDSQSGGHQPPVARFAWQINKAIHSYFSPNSVSQASSGTRAQSLNFSNIPSNGVRKGGLQARTLFSLKLNQRAWPPASSGGGGRLEGMPSGWAPPCLSWNEALPTVPSAQPGASRWCWDHGAGAGLSPPRRKTSTETTDWWAGVEIPSFCGAEAKPRVWAPSFCRLPSLPSLSAPHLHMRGSEN